MSNVKTIIFTLLVITAVAAAWNWDSMHLGGEINEKIYKGNVAYRGQFPYVVRIVNHYHKSMYLYNCTGSVISNRWILTTALCAENAVFATVLLGQTDINNFKGVLRFSLRKSDMLQHPEWDIGTAQNNIALYRLPTPIQFSKYPSIGRVNLPTKLQKNVNVFDNMNFTASGYGRYNDNSTRQYLRWATMHILNHTQCTDQLSKRKGVNNDIITDAMICSDTLLGRGFCHEIADLQILNRLTVHISDPSQLYQLKQSHNFNKYNLLAVVPMNQNILQQVCGLNDIDIISFIAESKPSFRLSRKLYRMAVDKSIYFEIPYGPAIMDSTCRKNIIATSHNYFTVGSSKNIIITSCASYPFYSIRGPYDIIHLGLVLGLNDVRTKDTITKNSADLIYRAETRRRRKSCLSTLKVVKPKSEENISNKEEESNKPVGQLAKRIKLK